MLSRQHNDTNVLALGSRVVGPEVAKMIVKAWLEAEFEGGRHAERLEIIGEMEAVRQAEMPGLAQTDTSIHSELISQTRRKIADTGRLLFGRHLTDAAGGNISARVGDQVCITPRYSGSKRHWQLQPHQVLLSDLLGNKLNGDGDLSREAKVHYRLYREFPDGMAVLHSHPRHVMVFVASGQPIEPILEATLKFETIPVVKTYAPAHSEKLADFIAEAMQGKDEAIRKYAVAVMAPWHGLFVVGKDLDAAFDLTERIDTNAYCILMSRLLPEGGPMDPEAMKTRLREAIQSFNDHYTHS
jgi:L-fuculose-phosphate aldolase